MDTPSKRIPFTSQDPITFFPTLSKREVLSRITETAPSVRYHFSLEIFILGWGVKASKFDNLLCWPNSGKMGTQCHKYIHALTRYDFMELSP